MHHLEHYNSSEIVSETYVFLILMGILAVWIATAFRLEMKRGNLIRTAVAFMRQQGRQGFNPRLVYHDQTFQIENTGLIMGVIGYAIMTHTKCYALYFTETGLLGVVVAAARVPWGVYWGFYRLFLGWSVTRRMRTHARMTTEQLFQDNPANFYVPYSDIGIIGLSRGTRITRAMIVAVINERIQLVFYFRNRDFDYAYSIVSKMLPGRIIGI